MIIYWQFFSSLKVILSTINNILYLLQCTERIPSLYIKKRIIQPPKILRNFHKTKIKIFDLALLYIATTRYSAKFGGFVSIHQKFFVKLIKCIGVCEECANLCSRRGKREKCNFIFLCTFFFCFCHDFSMILPLVKTPF